MEPFLKMARNAWVQRTAFLVLGGTAGYVYYFTIGCDGGCPLTGNPWSSTAYGALVGILLHPGRWINTPAKVAPESAEDTKD